MGLIFVLGLTLFLCLRGLTNPHVGIIGYFGYVVLCPQWNWRWSLPEGVDFQKYLAGAVLLGYVAAGFPGNKPRGSAALAVSGLVAFLGLAFVSSFQTVSVAMTSLYMDIMWKVVLMTGLGVILVNEPRHVLSLMWVVALAQGYNAFQINLQYFQDGYSYAAHYGWGSGTDNNLYANATVPALAITAALLIYATGPWQQALAGGILLLQMHQMMLLNSRGGMLAALLTVAGLALLMPRTPRHLTALAIGSVIAAALAGPPVVARFASTFAGREQLDGSAESRYFLWKAGYDITCDYPWLGAGPWAGETLVPRYYEGGLETSTKALHNLFFEISTGCGLPATLAYFTFFLAPWAALLHRRFTAASAWPEWAQCASTAVLAGIPGYLLGSCFSSGSMMETPYVLGILGAATLMLLPPEPTDPERTRPVVGELAFCPRRV